MDAPKSNLHLRQWSHYFGSATSVSWRKANITIDTTSSLTLEHHLRSNKPNRLNIQHVL